MCLKQLGPGVLNKRTFDARDQFEELFTALLSTRTLPETETPDVIASECLASREACQLQSLALSYSQKLYALPRHSNYSRHVIGTSGAKCFKVSSRWIYTQQQMIG